ncbi:DUF2934 domain-containing protein [Xanthobacter sp. V0B-10]|uniref:DUF2934 domain-containing protein n=1 Tax=Xanthobacter albus TaxID=3119929 RepID=UPI00372BEFF6
MSHEPKVTKGTATKGAAPKSTASVSVAVASAAGKGAAVKIHAETTPASAPAATDGLSPFERDQIRRRARAIWREEGCPSGRDREHWALAELQVLKSGVRP